MSEAIFYKLAALISVVALGWFVGRMRWLGQPEPGGNDPARVLSNAAFYLFVPALLFRTTARLELAALPWLTLAGFFIPVLGLIVAVYFWQRSRLRAGAPVARPSVQAITVSFGNTLQIGVPLAASVFGETGLAIHITVVSLHALTILSLLTLLVELDLAREQAEAQGSSLLSTLLATVRNTVIHPVVLPVLSGLVFNALGLRLPALLDEVLQLLGTAVVPLCLTLIGMSLAYYGWPAAWRSVVLLALLKLLLLPALVLGFAHGVLGVGGMPLAVIVMLAALPSGSNALIFAQRYRCEEGETTAAIVLSTLAFVLTAPLWLALLSWMKF
ncbi:AEC family transporter [Paucibacter sp. APW11]|uniref:AEC family transporter n=1 Tax=Roseateles aquae TaxID=3077235 RepID=A0ABU3PAD0_9BURK|nr:AEC family transporter [Paucibacter sp. APW11]MDT8999550.1 AEC family transporter [Paucibacter sp. APW11]